MQNRSANMQQLPYDSKHQDPNINKSKRYSIPTKIYAKMYTEMKHSYLQFHIRQNSHTVIKYFA